MTTALFRAYDEVGSSTTTSLLTVPTGHTYQINGVAMCNTGTSAKAAIATIQAYRGSTIYQLVFRVEIMPGESVLWDGGVSLSENDQLRVNNEGYGIVCAAVGGYDYY